MFCYNCHHEDDRQAFCRSRCWQWKVICVMPRWCEHMTQKCQAVKRLASYCKNSKVRYSKCPWQLLTLLPLFLTRRTGDLERQEGKPSFFSNLHKIKFLCVPSRSSFLNMYSGLLACLGLILSSPLTNFCMKRKGTDDHSFDEETWFERLVVFLMYTFPPCSFSGPTPVNVGLYLSMTLPTRIRK